MRFSGPARLTLRQIGLAALVLALSFAVHAQTHDIEWTRAVGASGGFVVFTATETTSQRLCGLSKGNTDAGFSDVDFAVYLNGSAVQVYESGILVGAFCAYSAGDRFRVEAGAGFVRYSRNGVALHTSTKAAALPLLVDTSLYTTGALVSSTP